MTRHLGPVGRVPGRPTGRSLPWLCHRFLLLGLATLTSSSCASVPQEAVVLSDFVGTQIAEHRASHEEFVRLYFEQSRDIVETFLRDRWIPEYLEDFVDRSGVVPLIVTPDAVLAEDDLERLETELDALAEVSPSSHPDIIAAVGRAFGDAERGQIMLEFAEAALAEIEIQRTELLEPLDAQEQEVLRHLSSSYAQLQQAQAQVTAHLASVREVTGAQDELLHMAGIRGVRDDALRAAIRLSDQLTAAAKAGTTAEDAIVEIRRILQTGGEGGSEG